VVDSRDHCVIRCPSRTVFCAFKLPRPLAADLQQQTGQAHATSIRALGAEVLKPIGRQWRFTNIERPSRLASKVRCGETMPGGAVARHCVLHKAGHRNNLPEPCDRANLIEKGEPTLPPIFASDVLALQSPRQAQVFDTTSQTLHDGRFQHPDGNRSTTSS